MMNGLPGAMGKEVSAACVRRGFKVASVALTGTGCGGTYQLQLPEESVDQTIELVEVNDSNVQKLDEIFTKAKAEYGDGLICIDFTHPSAVGPNSELYVKHMVPFVFGTTGGDRDALMKRVSNSGIYAVIAANMCKQIVALQATMEHMAENFPGAFSGYKLTITESHQSGKADTSGTAKDMMSYFKQLNGESSFELEDICKIRDRTGQLNFGVPEDSIAGHAFHTYELRSGDGSVHFQFQHNVCGRRTYAEGVTDAVQFLAQQIAAKSEKKVFSMIDILKAGAMR
jgi:4-hydroxy-tetrahydrodipicolinate reductase